MLANFGIGKKIIHLSFDDENIDINLEGENGIINIGNRLNFPHGERISKL